MPPCSFVMVRETLSSEQQENAACQDEVLQPLEVNGHCVEIELQCSSLHWKRGEDKTSGRLKGK